MIINLNTTIDNDNFINLGAHCSYTKVSHEQSLDFLRMVGYIQKDDTVIDMENIRCIKTFVDGSIFNIYVSHAFAEILTDTFDKNREMYNVNATILQWKTTQHKLDKANETLNYQQNGSIC